MNPIDETMRDFAYNKLMAEGGFEDPPMLETKIFGWDVWRVYRDSKKNILKIVLKNKNRFREFEYVNN
jgi:hypothetical protein